MAMRKPNSMSFFSRSSGSRLVMVPRWGISLCIRAVWSKAVKPARARAWTKASMMVSSFLSGRDMISCMAVASGTSLPENRSSLVTLPIMVIFSTCLDFR